jgi:hypothetical protein
MNEQLQKRLMELKTNTLRARKTRVECRNNPVARHDVTDQWRDQVWKKSCRSPTRQSLTLFKAAHSDFFVQQDHGHTVTRILYATGATVSTKYNPFDAREFRRRQLTRRCTARC